MSGTVVLSGGLLSAALVVALVGLRRRPARRLRRLTALPGGPGRVPTPDRSRLRDGETVGAPDGASPPPPSGRRLDAVRLAALLAGLAVAVVAGGWLGAVLGLPTAAVLDRALRRIESPAARNRRLREAEDLPLAADLLAAALRAGAPVDRSVQAVADALGGPLGGRMRRVGRLLRLGADPAEAWSPLDPVPGAERLTAAVRRSVDSGSALAGALVRVADDLRADRSTAAEAAARRAGVLIVLPLGLCFLPAFILAGLVPVIVAVLGDVL
ncbi:type II secretion system F family protein [Micromonospora endolithica]|uniref:Secretion system protein n=1 Tax=Micromonospora endolithica TaxID=230091 RepID=A0A3A9ZJL8_9ACTN|nr:type II secretion system F family protein [Micromonospora endolithica]RKN48419.1 secretion system protein [Micromonospora endolithica]TWJ24505.1 Flp pilus assembly protein TadB [Micromonospora endolithica]